MYDIIKYSLLLICGIMLVVVGLANKIDALGKLIYKEEDMSDPEKVEKRQKTAIPAILLGIVAIGFAIWEFTILL